MGTDSKDARSNPIKFERIYIGGRDAAPSLIRAKVSRPTTMKHLPFFFGFFMLLYELDSCEGLPPDHDETPAFFFALHTGVVGTDSKDARSNPIKFERIYIGGRDADLDSCEGLATDHDETFPFASCLFFSKCVAKNYTTIWSRRMR